MNDVSATDANSNPSNPSKPVRAHPVTTLDTEFFWNAARAHKLVIQRCCGCGELRHPPMPCCPHCHSFDWDTAQSSGRGSLISFTVVHAPLVPPFKEPYAVGLVELEEGTRLVAGIVHSNLESLSIGDPVVIEFMDCEGDLTLPVVRIVTVDTSEI